MGVYTRNGIVTNGLIAHYDAANSLSYTSGSNTLYDLSGNGNTGSIVANPAFNTINGGAFTFNGTSQYVNIGTPALLELYNNFSISVWFNSTASLAANTTAFLVSKDFSTGARGFGIGLSNNLGGSNKAYLEVNGGPSISNLGSVYANDKKWHNMALTVNSNLWTLYVDNSVIGSATPTAPTANALASWYIAGRAYVGAFAGFPGVISNSLVYNRVLSTSEILQNYNALKGRFGL